MAGMRLIALCTSDVNRILRECCEAKPVATSSQIGNHNAGSCSPLEGDRQRPHAGELKPGPQGPGFLLMMGLLMTVPHSHCHCEAERSDETAMTGDHFTRAM
jgi:hypothetical protein